MTTRLIRGVQITRRPNGTAFLWSDESIEFDMADLRSEFTVDELDDDGNETCHFADIVAQQKYIEAYQLELTTCEHCKQLMDFVVRDECRCRRAG